MDEKERAEFYQKRAKTLKERMFRRIHKNPDEIIGMGHGEYYLGQTWCIRTKKGLCFLVDKRCDLQSEHYIEMTHILTQAREKGDIHPVFHPVPVRNAPHRPYLVRKEVHGRTLDSTDVNDIAFTGLVAKILATQLSQIQVSSTKISPSGNNAGGFDLRPENFIIQNIDTENLLKDILELGGESTEKCIDFLDMLYEAGGKIWIFDYGTWLRPNSRGKNQ